MLQHEPTGIPRIATTGVIRSGIMVLTANAKQIDGIERRYKDGVEAGASWDTIKRTLMKEFNLDKSPLRPTNSPYFTVRKSDFSAPFIADALMEKYGERRGDDREEHIYELPVIFGTDNLLAALPHSLKCFTASGLKYWSEFDADGTRRCRMRAGLEKRDDGKFVRPFGGRQAVDRPDNEGLCEPEKCPQYQADPQECKMTGALVFYVPGIPGSAVELRTSSYYGMSQMRDQLLEMMDMRGSIAGTFRGEALFRLVKREESVSMLDLKTGQPKRVKQWVPYLDKTIDVSALFARAENAALSAPAAAAMLEGPRRDAPAVAVAEAEIVTEEDEKPF